MTRRLINTFYMSLMLSFVMSCWVTWINLGLISDFLARWMTAFKAAWPAAAVCAFFLGPVALSLTEATAATLSQTKPPQQKSETMDRINLEELGLPVGPYSHAVRHGDALYSSGFTAFATPAQTASIGPQTEAIFAQLKRLAASQGASIDQLIKVTIFITDSAHIPEIRDSLMAIYHGTPPASSMVIVKELFHSDLKVEIEAIFAL